MLSLFLAGEEMTLLSAVLKYLVVVRGCGRSVDNFLYDEAAFQVVSERAVTERMWLTSSQFSFTLFLSLGVHCPSAQVGVTPLQSPDGL